MRLAVALGLRDLVEPFPLGPFRRIAPVHRLAEGFDRREHPAVRQVAVVRDRQHVAAGLVLELGHPPPEVRRIVAAERLHRRVRNDGAGLGRAVAEDDVAVQVVAARVRRPLVSR